MPSQDPAFPSPGQMTPALKRYELKVVQYGELPTDRPGHPLVELMREGWAIATVIDLRATEKRALVYLQRELP